MLMPSNSLPNENFLHMSKLKALCRKRYNPTQKLKFVFGKKENNAGTYFLISSIFSKAFI